MCRVCANPAAMQQSRAVLLVYRDTVDVPGHVGCDGYASKQVISFPLSPQKLHTSLSTRRPPQQASACSSSHPGLFSGQNLPPGQRTCAHGSPTRELEQAGQLARIVAATNVGRLCQNDASRTARATDRRNHARRTWKERHRRVPCSRASASGSPGGRSSWESRLED